VTTEARYLRTPDGRVWTVAGPAHAFWRRYLDVFDRVRVVARVRDVPATPTGGERVDGPEVHVWPVPHYIGPLDYLRRWPAVRRSVRRSWEAADAVVLRLPSPLGALLASTLERHQHPYAVEVVGDPYDVLAPGVVRHPARPLLRVWTAARLRALCRRAAAVAYVTERALQARYPAGPTAITTHYSSIDLPPHAFVTEPRRFAPRPGPATFVCVGSLDQMYKGVDTLVAALAALGAGPDAHRLVHVGDGRFRPQLAELAVRLGVADRVTLAGAVPAGAVREYLDAADVFVLPSRTEGLPRALVEAMARGLPAIGSTAGGIPELLPAEDLVPPDDPLRLAEALRRLVDDPQRMAAASARNLARARDFGANALRPRRVAFYRAVRAATGQPSAATEPSLVNET
jgi:glycosyltransferase involved in cell wall biosynthesis